MHPITFSAELPQLHWDPRIIIMAWFSWLVLLLIPLVQQRAHVTTGSFLFIRRKRVAVVDGLRELSIAINYSLVARGHVKHLWWSLVHTQATWPTGTTPPSMSHSSSYYFLCPGHIHPSIQPSFFVFANPHSEGLSPQLIDVLLSPLPHPPLRLPLAPCACTWLLAFINSLA